MTDPIPMLLNCPVCHRRHIDKGEFATKPHRTHVCQQCGLVWRPALVATVGVQFLPGHKDAEETKARDSTPRGENNGNAQLTDEQRVEAIQMRMAGNTFVEIGRHFGVSESAIRRLDHK